MTANQQAQSEAVDQLDAHRGGICRVDLADLHQYRQAMVTRLRLCRLTTIPRKEGG
jgi:hypothetical protein